MYERIVEEIKKYECMRYLSKDLFDYKSMLNNLYKYGMVLIGPDAFRQNEVLEIIEFFELQGFVLIDLKIKNLNKTQTEMLFLPTSSCIKCSDLKWWMIQDSADQGMFCSAIFYNKSANEEKNCLNLLNTFKGKSNPIDNKVGVVRYDFSAINVCLNLIHIPDSYGDFFKDITPFYNISEIMRIIEKKEKDDQKNKYNLFAVKLYQQNNKKYLFELELYKVKYLLAYLIFDEKSRMYLMDYYSSVYYSIETEFRREKRNLLIKEKISVEKEIIEKIKLEFFVKIKEQEYDVFFDCIIEDLEILRFLRIFTVPNLFKIYERNIYNEISVRGIVLNDFEKLILNTSLIQWK